MLTKVQRDYYFVERFENKHFENERHKDDFLTLTALREIQEKGIGLLVCTVRKEPLSLDSVDIFDLIVWKIISVFTLPKVDYEFLTVNQLLERDNKLPVIYENFKGYTFCDKTLSEIVEEEASTSIIKATRKRLDRNLTFDEQHIFKKGDKYWGIESERIEHVEHRLHKHFGNLKESIQYVSQLQSLESTIDELYDRANSIWIDLNQKEDELKAKKIMIDLISQLKVSENEVLNILPTSLMDRHEWPLYEQLHIIQLFISDQSRLPTDANELDEYLNVRCSRNINCGENND